MSIYSQIICIKDSISIIEIYNDCFENRIIYDKLICYFKEILHFCWYELFKNIANVFISLKLANKEIAYFINIYKYYLLKIRFALKNSCNISTFDNEDYLNLLNNLNIIDLCIKERFEIDHSLIITILISLDSHNLNRDIKEQILDKITYSNLIVYKKSFDVIILSSIFITILFTLLICVCINRIN